jgi:hypothetical protein
MAQRRGTGSMVIAGIVVAILLAAGALGVGVIALLSSPAAVAGPQGATGIQGAAGPQGSQGVPGPQGTTGPAGSTGPKGNTGLTGKPGQAGATGATGARGPVGATGASGTIVASTAVPGTPVLSQIDPPVGTTVTATATCPQSDVALGGGGQVSASGAASKSVTLRSSYPTSTNGWRAVGSVIGTMGITDQMSVRPYVLCGKAPHS